MNKKLKLTKLTVTNLERIKGGDTVCLCQVFPDGSSDEAHQQVVSPSQGQSGCGYCTG